MSPTTGSSQGEDSEAMFPAANDALSNLLATTSNQQTAGELSPPYSQDQPDANGDEAMDLTGGEPTWDMPSQTTNAGNGLGGVSESYRMGEAQYVPGQSWDNPKAREESQRQWSGLLDKNFSLSGCSYQWEPCPETNGWLQRGSETHLTIKLRAQNRDSYTTINTRDIMHDEEDILCMSVWLQMSVSYLRGYIGCLTDASLLVLTHTSGINTKFFRGTKGWPSSSGQIILCSALSNGW